MNFPFFWGAGVREGAQQTPEDVIKSDEMDERASSGGAKEGYDTALYIVDRRPRWLVLWVGVKGATPASRCVAMGPVAMAAAKHLISRY